MTREVVDAPATAVAVFAPTILKPVLRESSASLEHYSSP